MPERFSKTPEIYTTIPPQPKEKKPGQLSHEELKQYFEEGYVVVQSFFTKEELQPVIESINEIVDDVAEKLYKAGKISNKHVGATFYNRLTLLEKEFPGAAVLVHKKGILPKAFQDFWSNERLLNVVEQMIGTEICGHPVWNLRSKVPKNDQVTVPWHQGKGGHKKGYLAKHYCCAGPTHYVELKEENMVQDLGVDMQKDIVLCEVPMGGILFINNLLPHRSLQNYSNQIRWSVDLRWCVPGKPNGFYNLKENVLMRTAKDANLTINWEKFMNTDRSVLQAGATNEVILLSSWHSSTNTDESHNEDQELDTTISGPWMGQWEIIHHNKNTERYLENEKRIKASMKD